MMRGGACGNAWIVGREYLSWNTKYIMSQIRLRKVADCGRDESRPY